MFAKSCCLLLVAYCTFSWAAINIDDVVNNYKKTIAQENAVRIRKDNTTCGNTWFSEEHRRSIRKAIHDFADIVDAIEEDVKIGLHKVEVWAKPVTQPIQKAYHAAAKVGHTVWSWLKKQVNDAVDVAVSAYHAVKNGVVKFYHYMAPVVEFFKKLGSHIAEEAKVVFHMAVHAAEKVGVKLQPMVDAMATEISKGYNVAKSAIKTVIDPVLDAGKIVGQHVVDGVTQVGVEIVKVGDEIYIYLKPYVEPIMNCVAGYMSAIAREEAEIHKDLMANFETYNETMEFLADVLGNPTDQADEMTAEEKFVQMDKVRRILKDVATDFGDGSSLRI